MFYYPTVLKRHTGCFSTIWLVATKGIRVPRRDFLKVNVKSTCDDIMNYVLEQVPPPRPGLPRPRFSLYLSSQLQYGVVVVYHRQCAILLEELQSVVGQLLKRPPSKIDMVEQSRQALDFPDALSLQEETEGAPDPLFGVMYMKTLTPSPTSQMGLEYLRETSPEHPEVTSPAAPDDAAAVGITASPDTITLREMEPVALPAAEFEGVELVDQHPETIDLLLAQTDHFTEEDVETQREAVSPGEEEMEMEMEMERDGPEGDLVKEGTKELTGSTIELQPTTVSSEDAMLMLQEEPGLSVEKPGPTTDQLTPVSVPVIPSPPSAERERQRPALESEDVPPPEVRTRRRGRRQLIFFDPNTQLSEKLQEQIDNPEAETGRPPLLLSSSRRRLPAAELLDNPCTLLPEEIQFLWRQAATVTPVSGLDLLAGDRGPESTDSEKEREREAAEREEETPEFSFKEVPRGVAEPEMMPELSGNGSLPLEGFVSREASREISPMYTPETEGSPVSRSVSILQDIPEVQEELQKTPAPESPGLPPLELAEHIASPVLFESLLPPEVDRRTVSQSFQRLLVNLSARRLRVEQDEPYGDILIFPGPNYEETQLTA